MEEDVVERAAEPAGHGGGDGDAGAGVEAVAGAVGGEMGGFVAIAAAKGHFDEQLGHGVRLG